MNAGMSAVPVKDTRSVTGAPIDAALKRLVCVMIQDVMNPP